MGFVKAVVTIVTTILVMSSGVIAESGKKYSNQITEPTEGDYFEFDVELVPGSLMLLGAKANYSLFELKDFVHNTPQTFRITYDGDSCVNLPSLSGECSRWVTTSERNITLIHDDDAEIHGDTSIWSDSRVVITENADGVSWSESTLTSDFWGTMLEEKVRVQHVEVETRHVTLGGSEPSEFSVGDTWTLTSESDIIIDRSHWVQIIGIGNESRTFNQTEKSWSNATNYNAESTANVSANGVIFETIRLSSQQEWSSAKDVAYYSEHGVPVKLEFYNEDGDLEMMLTLKEYRYLNENTDNGGIGGILPGFNAIAAVSMIGIATVFPRGSRGSTL